jgi:hypothetical protein
MMRMAMCGGKPCWFEPLAEKLTTVRHYVALNRIQTAPGRVYRAAAAAAKRLGSGRTGGRFTWGLLETVCKRLPREEVEW